MNKLYVLIGVDCDNDRLRFNRRVKQNKVLWTGYKNFYQYFNVVRQKILQETGLEPVLTLNIRADYHVKESLGKFDSCFDIFEDYIYGSFNNRDEIAWHNHHFRRKNNVWFQEEDDNAWIGENISKSFDAIKKYNIHTLHTGWCFQNTFTMNLYNDLRIKVDYSGLPKISKATGICDKYNYKLIENDCMYIPSRDDYQQKDILGLNNILEIPVTTVENSFINLLNVFDKIQKTKQINNFSSENVYLNITINPFLYNIFLKSVFQKNKLNYFITYFHSDELLPDNLKNAQANFLFKRSNIYYNLKRLILLARERGRSVEFVNFRDFYKIYESGYFNQG